MNPRDDIPGDDTPQDPTLTRLYRELPDVAPSANTDALIRAAARRAAGAGPRRGLVAAHWRGLGSAAAMLLLGVALTVQWRTREPARLDEALAAAPSAAPAAPADTAIEGLTGRAAPTAAVPVPPPATASAPATDSAAKAAGTVARNRAQTAPAAAAMPEESRNEQLADTAADAPAVASAAPAPQRAASADAMGGVAPSAPGPGGAVAAAPPMPVAMEERLAQAAASAEREVARKEAPRRALAAKAATDAPRSTAPAAAPAPLAAAADYRVALAAGRYADALDLLAAPSTAAARLDRELLLQWLQPGRRPDCAGVALPEDAALLCEGLAHRASGLATTPEWRARVEATGLASGEFAYRRGLVNALFGAPPPP